MSNENERPAPESAAANAESTSAAPQAPVIETSVVDAKAAVSSINAIVNQAVASYARAVKSGIKLQEESLNAWKDLFGKIGAPEQIQVQIESLRGEIVPAAKKQAEQLLETVNRTSSQALELFEKSLGVCQSKSVAEAQRGVQELYESSLAETRVNIDAFLNTNAAIVSSLTGVLNRIVPAAA